MSKSVGTGPSSYEKRIYWATVSQRLRNADLRTSFSRVGLSKMCHISEDLNPGHHQYGNLRSQVLICCELCLETDDYYIVLMGFYKRIFTLVLL